MKTCLIRSSMLSASGVLVFAMMLTACQKQSENIGSSGGSATSSGVSTAERMENSDAVITAKVKAALINNRQIKNMNIHVDTDQGEVILSGLVNSNEQSEQAIKIAQSIDGVKKVTNKMSIRKS